MADYVRTSMDKLDPATLADLLNACYRVIHEHKQQQVTDEAITLLDEMARRVQQRVDE